MRQYQSFLGNPDPTGPNETTYAFRSATPPSASPPVAAIAPAQRDWASTVAVAAGLLLAAAGALLAWSRS
jgi:hypothetical protein